MVELVLLQNCHFTTLLLVSRSALIDWPTSLNRSGLGREEGSPVSSEGLVHQPPGNGNGYEPNQGLFATSAQALCIRQEKREKADVDDTKTNLEDADQGLTESSSHVLCIP